MADRAANWLAHHARRQPNKIAYVDAFSRRECSYSEADRAAERVAGYLGAVHGIRREDRVGLLCHNAIDAQILQFACQRLGAIFAPLNWRLALPELDFLIGDLEPKVIFAGPEFVEKADSLIRRNGIGARLTLDAQSSDFERAASTPTRPPPAADLSFDDTWQIFFTSGTTGRPKGARYTYRMAHFGAVNVAIDLKISRDSVGLAIGPTFHLSGFAYPCNPMIMFGGTGCIMRTFDAGRALDLLLDDALGITHYMGVPTHLQMMTDLPRFKEARFDRLVSTIVGGAPTPVPLMEVFVGKGMKLHHGWGMTETAGGAQFLADSLALEKAGSTGLDVMYVETRIASPEGESTPPGADGELLVRGPTVTPGYWNRPEANASSFREGWFKTGDVFRQDDDGYHFILDRRNDMYISGGENVYPAEVELALRDCPGVADIAVIGVPDEKWGKVGKAFVIRSAGAAVAAGEIIAFARERLARYKIPVHYEFVGDFPRTPSLKPAKNILAAEAEARAGAAAKATAGV